jgi:predicted nucleic-acid-binding Zn-ribbon protein
MYPNVYRRTFIENWPRFAEVFRAMMEWFSSAELFHRNKSRGLTTRWRLLPAFCRIIFGITLSLERFPPPWRKIVRHQRKGEISLSIKDIIEDRFVCVKCKGQICDIREVSMTGAGLSKMFDIQHIHYLFVSCKHCGNVEVLNPDILEGKKKDQLGTILDIFFGS